MERVDRYPQAAAVPGSALVVVDVQRDFCPGGSLAVPHADRIFPVVNRWLQAFAKAGLPIVFTQDFHPPGHVSFQERGGPWPPHCVAGSPGAEIHPAIQVPRSAVFFRKGEAPDRDAYSGFEGTHAAEPRVSLAGWLHQQAVKRLWVMGLATEYCVRATALDGLRHGFEVALVAAGTAGIDKALVTATLGELSQAGAAIIG